MWMTAKKPQVDRSSTLLFGSLLQALTDSQPTQSPVIKPDAEVYISSFVISSLSQNKKNSILQWCKVMKIYAVLYSGAETKLTLHLADVSQSLWTSLKVLQLQCEWQKHPISSPWGGEGTFSPVSHSHFNLSHLLLQRVMEPDVFPWIIHSDGYSVHLYFCDLL